MLSLDRILKVAQFNEEYGYYSPTMEQHTRRQPAMTFDDWKATLLPLGWMVVDKRTIESPKNFLRQYLRFKGNNQYQLLSLFTHFGAVGIPNPPDLATMRALMTGLQIPMTKEGA